MADVQSHDDGNCCYRDHWVPSVTLLPNKVVTTSSIVVNCRMLPLPTTRWFGFSVFLPVLSALGVAGNPVAQRWLLLPGGSADPRVLEGVAFGDLSLSPCRR
jgi:hypothetical protein